MLEPRATYICNLEPGDSGMDVLDEYAGSLVLYVVVIVLLQVQVLDVFVISTLKIDILEFFSDITDRHPTLIDLIVHLQI